MGKEAKYVIRLTEEERSALQELIGKPRVAAAKVLRARMVLKADVDGPSWSDPKIGEAFEVGLSTVQRLRQRLVEEGLEAALSRRPSTQRREAKLDGAEEGPPGAVGCSRAPARPKRLTFPTLAHPPVALDGVGGGSAPTR